MKFIKWMEDYNISKLSKKLGVTRECIYFWRNGKREPKLYLAIMIIKLAKGKLKYEDLLEPSIMRGK